MNGFKKLTLLAVCTFALFAAATAPASAITAHLEIDDGGGPIGDCDVTFDSSGVPPTSPITINNLTTTSCSVPIDIVSFAGTLTIGGNASFAGSFTVNAGFWNCTYSGTFTGPVAATSLSGTATTAGFLCPSPVTVSLTNIAFPLKTANIEFNDGSGVILDCDLIFKSTGAPPTSPITISNLTPTSCSVPALVPGGGGTLTIGATASFAGSITTAAEFWNCTYSGNLTGAAAATNLTGYMTTGGFLCPSPVTATLSSITY